MDLETRGWIERRLMAELQRPTGPVGTSWLRGCLYDDYDGKSESLDVSVRRALGELEEKGLVAEVPASEVDRVDDPIKGKLWETTEAGEQEAERLKEEYKKQKAELRKRFGQRY